MITRQPSMTTSATIETSKVIGVRSLFASACSWYYESNGRLVLPSSGRTHYFPRLRFTPFQDGV